MISYYTILLEPTAETGYSHSTVHSIWNDKDLAERFADLHRSAYPEWRVTVEDTSLCDEKDFSLLSAEMMEDDNPLVDNENVDEQSKQHIREEIDETK